MPKTDGHVFQNSYTDIDFCKHFIKNRIIL